MPRARDDLPPKIWSHGSEGGGIVTRKGAVTKWIGNEKRFDEDKKMTADESS